MLWKLLSPNWRRRKVLDPVRGVLYADEIWGRIECEVVWTVQPQRGYSLRVYIHIRRDLKLFSVILPLVAAPCLRSPPIVCFVEWRLNISGYTVLTRLSSLNIKCACGFAKRKYIHMRLTYNIYIYIYIYGVISISSVTWKTGYVRIIKYILL
jgi:hypothetical protein